MLHWAKVCLNALYSELSIKKPYLVNYHFLMQKVLEADREDLLTYVIKFLIHEYIQLSLYTKNSQFSWLMKAKRNCCTIDKKNEIHNFLFFCSVPPSSSCPYPAFIAHIPTDCISLFHSLSLLLLEGLRTRSLYHRGCTCWSWWNLQLK